MLNLTIYIPVRIIGKDYTTHLTGWTNKTDIEQRINIEHGDVPFEIRGYYIDNNDNWELLRGFLAARQQWRNEHLVFSKSAQVKKSAVMRGILGEQELKIILKTSIQMDLEKFNIWYLSGDIKGGIITTKPLPPLQ